MRRRNEVNARWNWTIQTWDARKGKNFERVARGVKMKRSLYSKDGNASLSLVRASSIRVIN